MYILHLALKTGTTAMISLLPAPLKLRPYGAIQMSILLLLLLIFVTFQRDVQCVYTMSRCFRVMVRDHIVQRKVEMGS